MRTSAILLTGLIIVIIGSTAAQAQFREGHSSASEHSAQNLSVDQLLSPTLQNLAPTELGSVNFSSNTDLITFSKTAKFFLSAGASLIRGGTEDVPMYSFENAWKYPGPTVKYPETATEYELFLERYQRYTSDN